MPGAAPPRQLRAPGRRRRPLPRSLFPNPRIGGRAAAQRQPRGGTHPAPSLSPTDGSVPSRGGGRDSAAGLRNLGPADQGERGSPPGPARSPIAPHQPPGPARTRGKRRGPPTHRTPHVRPARRSPAPTSYRQKRDRASRTRPSRAAIGCGYVTLTKDRGGGGARCSSIGCAARRSLYISLTCDTMFPPPAATAAESAPTASPPPSYRHHPLPATTTPPTSFSLSSHGSRVLTAARQPPAALRRASFRPRLPRRAEVTSRPGGGGGAAPPRPSEPTVTSAHVLWASARGTVGGRGARSRALGGRATRLPTAVNGRGARSAPPRRGARGGRRQAARRGGARCLGAPYTDPKQRPAAGCGVPSRGAPLGPTPGLEKRTGERAPRLRGSGLRCGGSGGRRRDEAPYISEERLCPAPRFCTRPGLSKRAG